MLPTNMKKPGRQYLKPQYGTLGIHKTGAYLACVYKHR